MQLFHSRLARKSWSKMCRELVFFVAVTIFQPFPVLVQSKNCPTFGTNQPSPLTRSPENGLFMNFEAPFQCRGNVIGWRYCYYNVNESGNVLSNMVVLQALFIVYRQSSNLSPYRALTESVRTVSIPWNVGQGSSFICMDEELSLSEHFEIQENDIIGACLKQLGNTQPLSLVGTSSGSTYRTYKLDRVNIEYCTESRYAVITSDSEFVQRRTSVLHLFANIAVAAVMCTAGNNPPASNTLMTGNLGGTYLNTQYPVTCGNHITKWNFCYYTEAATPGSTLSMTVAVWSLNADTSTYIVSPNSIKNIEIQHVQNLAKIFCMEMSLNESEFILVSPGDVIGVVLPSAKAIPIVSSTSNTSMSIKNHPNNGNPTNILQSDLSNLSATSLHLYSTINILTSSPETTTLPTLSTITTSSEDSESTAQTTMLLNYTSTTSMTTTSSAVSGSTTETTAIYSMLTDTHQSSMPNKEIEIVTTITTTRRMENEQQNSPLGGEVAAIVLSVFLVLVASVLIAFVAVYIRRKMKKKKLHQMYPLISPVVYSNSSNAEDEVVYDVPYYSELHIFSEVPEQRNHKLSSDCNTDGYSLIDDYYKDVNYSYAYQEELERFRKGYINKVEERIYTDPGNNEDEIYSFLKKKNIKEVLGNEIIMENALGSGQFGTVCRGKWNASSGGTKPVALKCLKKDATSTDRLKLLQEAATMAQFSHPNVAALYGVTTKDGQMMLVVELLNNGDLRQYLQTLLQKPKVEIPTPRLLLQFSQQICLGMNYLACTGYIHRDLAARNILVSESLICKIADFGMSRDLFESDYYKSSGGKIPLKWTAPEAIHYKKYSTASDVWSYGCVLYEIWSLGHKPFEDMGNIQVLTVLDTGARLSPPPGCPKKIYEIMMQCWSPDPQQRPSYKDILINMLENESIVLHIPLEVTDKHPQAATLGAPLKAGLGMYSTLQKTYLSN